MGKLRLVTDEVQVESFVLSEDAGMRGTVHAKGNTLLWCYSFEDTCWNRGCNTGVTAPAYCPTAEGETCNGWPGCDPTGQTTGYTADQTCSDFGCTVCVAWC